MHTAIARWFAALFDRDLVLDAARRFGAVERVRALHPCDVLLSVISCALGDEQRGIATARREFFRLTGYMPEESSFYERLKPGMVQLAWSLFLGALARTNRTQRKQIARALGVSVKDVRAVDASQVTLPGRAAGHFPSANSQYGGFKVTVTLSVLEDLVTAVHITDARQHDRKAFHLPQDRRGILWLMDRGYCDHRLFAEIDSSGGFFLARLKNCSVPTVRQIRSGLAPRHRNQPMHRTLPFDGIVDLDAAFSVGNQTRLFRVVGIPVLKKSKLEYVWLVTNLSSRRVRAHTVGQLYRLRWGIENLFRVLKTVGRLDHIRSGNPAVIGVFTIATLIALALAQATCSAMRAERPGCEPSHYRVLTLLLGHLPVLASAGNSRLRSLLHEFVAALWREGLSPNPGRASAWRRHMSSVEK